MKKERKQQKRLTNLVSFFLFLFHRINCNSTNDENKNCCSYKKNVKTKHFYASLFKIVAIIKQIATNIKPKIKVLKINSFPISCPRTNPEKDNFPTSYNAFANSFLWFLSNRIIKIIPETKEYCQTKMEVRYEN